jgi:hypothetical protein
MAAAAAWYYSGRPLNFKFLVPPSQIIFWLIFGVAIDSLGYLFSSYSTYVSSIDFRLLFRMSGLFWNSLFGLLFLGEAISRRGIMSLIVVFVGLCLSMYHFQWTTELLSSTYQAIGIVAEILLESLSSLICRHSFAILHRSALKTAFSLYSFSFYQYVGTFLCYALSAIARDSAALNHLATIFAPLFLGKMLFSSLLGELSCILLARLHNEASMMSIGVVKLFRILICLIVSHFLLGETEWHARQTIGAVFLFGGGFLNLVAQKAKERSPSPRIPEGDGCLANVAYPM